MTLKDKTILVTGASSGIMDAFSMKIFLMLRFTLRANFCQSILPPKEK